MTYEGMFLFDPTFAVEWTNVEAEINRVLGRAGAELILCKKWDERKLAYEIQGRKRGCYVLTYFKAPPSSVSGLERDVKLSESILRCLILKADRISEEKMRAPVPAESTRTSTDEGRGEEGDSGHARARREGWRDRSGKDHSERKREPVAAGADDTDGPKSDKSDK